MNVKTIILWSACLAGACSVRSQTPLTAYTKPAYPASWNAPTVMPDRIMLTCTEDPAHTASVTWRTDAGVVSAEAEIALVSAAPTFWETGRRFKAATSLMDATHIPAAGLKAGYHHVVFTGLLPDTLYAYRVGSGKHWSEWFQFRTAGAVPKPFSFIYLGDAQSDIFDRWSRTIRSAIQKVPDARFIIHAGDLVGSAHDDRHWQEWFRAGGWIHATVPGVPIPGNHEYQVFDKKNTADSMLHLSYQWKYQFNLPQNGLPQLKGSSYFFNYQQEVLIVALNSNELEQEQAKWLDSLLTHTRATWKIVTLHHPLFSGARERDNAYLRALLKPLLDKHRVDLVLSGHDHTYTRGIATDPGKGRIGTVYVVSVAGGKMYDASAALWENYEARLLSRGEHKQLFQAIHINGRLLRYEAFTPDGKLYDSFELKKHRRRGNSIVELP